jgi:hypothetical protein
VRDFVIPELGRPVNTQRRTESAGQPWQPINLILRLPILDRHVLALDIAWLPSGLKDRDGDTLVVNFSGLGAEEPDHRQHRLLRLRQYRPRRRAHSRRRILESSPFMPEPTAAEVVWKLLPGLAALH